MQTCINQLTASVDIKEINIIYIRCHKLVRHGILCDNWNGFRCGKVDTNHLPDENSPWICPHCIVFSLVNISENYGDNEVVNYLAIITVLQVEVTSLQEDKNS